MKRKVYITPIVRVVYCDMESLLNTPSKWIPDDDPDGGGDFKYDEEEDEDEFGGGT